jgi:hypothetical protein
LGGEGLAAPFTAVREGGGRIQSLSKLSVLPRKIRYGL